jgi:hypothetical protein
MERTQRVRVRYISAGNGVVLKGSTFAAQLEIDRDLCLILVAYETFFRVCHLYIRRSTRRIEA